MGGWTFNTPEFVANDGLQISIIAIVFTTISLLALSLRFYVRGCMIRAIGADDWILTITWIASCGFTIVSVAQTKWGLGLKHLNDMPDENLYNFGLLQYMGAPFYITSILGFKLSLLLSYLRFMTKGVARYATIAVLVACVLFHVAFLLVQTNLCQPVAKQWDPAITSGRCLPAVPFYTSMASLTITFDIAIMLLPFPVLIKTQIQKRKKFALLGLFALGTFITVIQVLRIQTIKNLSNYLDSSSLIMWSTVENNLGIIVASIPTLAPLFKYFAEKTQKSSVSNSASRVKSGYTLKSWRGMGSGAFPLSSGVHQASKIHGSSEDEGEATLLENLRDDAITKTTKVVISLSESEQRRDPHGIGRT